MSGKRPVMISPGVSRAIASWGLSDFVFVEVQLQLRDVLPSNPTLLLRTKAPFDGLSFGFHLIDPENRLRVHYFVFQVRIGQDEETLYVVGSSYRRADGA